MPFLHRNTSFIIGIYLCTVLLFGLTAPELPSNQHCSKDDKSNGGDCSNGGSSGDSKYGRDAAPSYLDQNKKWANYLIKLDHASKDYVPCVTPTDSGNQSSDWSNSCYCFKDQIDKDLEPWKAGEITRSMLDELSDRGSRYQIINHRLYREAKCMFPARCSGVEHFLLKLAPRLPDLEFVLNTRDWPQMVRHWNPPLPLFSFSKDAQHRDIMYPAWTFWEGGPAISFYPTGLGRWDLRRDELSKAGKAVPWDQKLPKAFFRGSRTSAQRDPLVLLSRRNPDLVDAKYTKNQAWKSLKDTLGEEPAGEVSFAEHCKYRYLFNFRGVAASFRFKHLFLCQSLVFHVDSEWLEFFYPPMRPWVHFLPVAEDLSDVELLLQFAKENDEVVKQIARRGFEFIWDHLTLDSVDCYWQYLLQEYGKLLKYTVNRDVKLIEIK